jgi:hypothetical protein
LIDAATAEYEPKARGSGAATRMAQGDVGWARALAKMFSFGVVVVLGAFGLGSWSVLSPSFVLGFGRWPVVTASLRARRRPDDTSVVKDQGPSTAREHGRTKAYGRSTKDGSSLDDGWRRAMSDGAAMPTALRYLPLDSILVTLAQSVRPFEGSGVPGLLTTSALGVYSM